MSSLAFFVKNTEVKSSLPENPTKFYNEFTMQFATMLEPLEIKVALLGQKQLLRRQLANILSFKCKLESNALFCTLDVMNKSIINDIQLHYRNPEKPYPGGEDSILFVELAKYLENIGLNDPLRKIYVTTNVIHDLSAIIFLLLLRQVGKFTFDVHLGTKPGKKNLIDDTPYAIGLITLMKQFHTSILPEFLSYVGQYVRATINEFVETNTKAMSYPLEAQKILLFVDVISRFGNIPRTLIEEYIPSYIFTEYLQFQK